MAEIENSKGPLRSAIRTCGARVLIGLIAVIVPIAILVWVSEHNAIERGWSWSLWAASDGGHSRWFAISGASLVIAVVAWGGYVHVKTAGRLSIALRVWGCLACVAIWSVVFAGAMAMGIKGTSVSTFFALLVIWIAPVAVVVVGIIFFLISPESSIGDASGCPERW